MDNAKAGEAAASGILDSLRHLLNALAALLPPPVGPAAAQDAVDSRSLPALGKVLKRLWFEADFGGEWEAAEQVAWVAQLLLVSQGCREGILSFYGGGVLLCDSLLSCARCVYPHVGLPLDEAWCQSLGTVRTALERDFSEELKCLPADHLCGSKRDGLVSTNRLPVIFRRMFDLEGHRLTPVQKAGLGVAIVMPGSGMLAVGGIGAALLLRRARQSNRGVDEDPFQTMHAKCLEQAQWLLRRKENPIEVTYLPGAAGLGPPQVKVAAHVRQSMAPLSAVPVGSLGTDGVGVACLNHGETCHLRPTGASDDIVVRVFRPSLINEVLHNGVEVSRGSRVVIVPSSDGGVKCYASLPRAPVPTPTPLHSRLAALATGGGAPSAEGACVAGASAASAGSEAFAAPAASGQ
uniref:Uncharacterized protein n=1 Tax=Pyrodinium bahamense TaxID=73915 RepID=A0A7S0ASU7_9DINO|mmetsp:Transcript_41593/g.115751  ORF Transcript_41593/g.115751 Transcript_41593/m.115751 type:complete len:407 (+) Transcript_41593:109-1329(+)